MKPYRRLTTTIALGLSVLVAFAMPLGDVAMAATPGVETESNPASILADEEPAAELEAPSDDPALAEDIEVAPTPQPETEGSGGSEPATEDQPRAEEPTEDPDAEREPADEQAEAAEPATEAPLAAAEETPLAATAPRALIGPMSAGDSTTPHAYFSLRQEGTAGGTGDDRGTISAIIDKYVVNPTGPSLTPQSASHPTQSLAVPLEGDRQADSMPGNPGRNVTRYQYRVSQTNFSTNSLGVAPNGDAYFTVQFNEERRQQTSYCTSWDIILCWGGWGWNGWSGWSQQSQRYLSIWKVNIDTGAGGAAPILQRNTSISEHEFTGGAVNTNGVYYFSYFANHTSPSNSMRYHIYRLNEAGSATADLATTATTVANSRGAASTGGDIAFDGYNNLHVLVGGSGTQSSHSMIPAQNVPESGSSNPTGIASTAVSQTAPPGQIAGIAFPFGSHTVWQGGTSHYLRNMASLGTAASSQNYSSFAEQRDLASIAQRPSFQLKLQVLGGLVNPGDRFTLSATPGATAQSVTTMTGATSAQLSPSSIPVTRALDTPLSTTNPTATVPFSIAAAGTANLSTYAQAYSCVDLRSGATISSGSSVSGSAAVTAIGNRQVECTVTLTRSAPNLIVSKRAYVGGTELARDAVVSAGTVIQYRLLFDNSTGTAAATGIDYTDHLADLLDDATLTTSAAVTPAGGLSVASTGGNYRITGSVPTGQSRTVTFSVTVKANATDAVARAEGSPSSSPVVKGYRLNNYLVKAGDPAPTANCAVPAPGEQPRCTTNPIRAWSVRKDSQPEDGAMIHSGGNIYYRVKITNYSGETVTGVSIEDDMTHTLSATTWDPAPPPITGFGTAYGLSFYTADGGLIPGGTIDWSALPAQDQPVPEFSGSASFDPLFPGGLPFPNGTWTFETPTFTIPAEIAGQKVAYAIVGYAVQGGFVADPSDPETAFVDGGAPVRALPNAIWVNTVQAGQASVGGHSLYPNRCSAEGGGVPPGDIGAYYDCKVWHSIGESYFHIWKKTADTSTGTSNNLLGSTFVLADTYDDAIAGTPSRWLCRTNNDPGVGSAYVPPGSDPDPGVSGDPDWGAASDTYDAIAAWNLANPADQREQCGRFFYLATASEGQAAGSWRALDIRGGDTVPGGSDPLPNWREASGYNNGVDDSDGRHGTYWLVETVSPSDHQLLAKPMRLWVAPNSPTPETGGLAPGMPAWYDYQGRLSMPASGEAESSGGIRQACTGPYALPANSQPSCVMPTGWTMPVFDVKLQPLPLTGGLGTGALVLGGGAVLAMALAGIWWWRRRAAGSDPDMPRRGRHRGGGEH